LLLFVYYFCNGKGVGLKKLIAVIVSLLVLSALGFAYIYSGRYDIAANKPHHGITLWMLNLTIEKSVARRARDIQVPNLSDSMLVQFGAHHYMEMCVECHGAPGAPRSEMGNDMYPRGPQLIRAAKNWKPEELYWITKNGIKMTGMPAWGLTTDDHELWALVAFMEQLPSISPERYHEMAEGTEQDDHDHH
jgi:mono/diheme cytochrome c family protein